MPGGAVQHGHPVPLVFKAFIADLVCPHGRADRLTQERPLPCAGLPRVSAVAHEEGGLEGRPSLPFLAGESGQVGQGRAQRRSAEVDDVDLPLIVEQPVAWLPVAVGRHEHRRWVIVVGDDPPQLTFGVGIDPVFRIEPADRPSIHVGLVVRADGRGLLVKGGQQFTGLTVDLRVVRRRRPVDQGTGKIAEGDEILLVVGVQETIDAASPSTEPRLL